MWTEIYWGRIRNDLLAKWAVITDVLEVNDKEGNEMGGGL